MLINMMCVLIFILNYLPFPNGCLTFRLHLVPEITVTQSHGHSNG